MSLGSVTAGVGAAGAGVSVAEGGAGDLGGDAVFPLPLVMEDVRGA